jgi:lysozyme family protein
MTSNKIDMRFEQSMRAVLKHEGGYVDHPKDPGGATNMGITHATLSAWRRKPVTKRDVQRLSQLEAKKIYRAQYADPVQFNALPAGLGYAVLDFAIHSGVRRASRYLQSVVGAKADGFIGTHTLNAVYEACRSQGTTCVIQALQDKRLRFLQRLKGWRTFGRGWARRMDDVTSLALAMAKDDSVLPDPKDIGAAAKADGPVKKPSLKPVAAVGAIGVAGTALQDASQQIEPLSALSPLFGYLFAGLVVAGVGLTLWHAFHRQPDDDGLVQS